MKYRWGGAPSRSEASAVGKSMRQKGKTVAMVMAAVSKKPAAPAAPSQTTVWQRVATGYTLSNSDRTVTSPNDAAVGGADTASSGNVYNTGKYYFEITATTITSDGDWAGGISQGGTNPPVNSLTDGLAGGGKVMARASGNWFPDNISMGVTFVQGDILGVAVDMDAGYVWFAKNGTYVLSGNPAAGTNPIDTFLTNRYVIPMTSSDNSAGVSAWTLGTTDATCTYTAPSGFSYWDA